MAQPNIYSKKFSKGTDSLVHGYKNGQLPANERISGIIEFQSINNTTEQSLINIGVNIMQKVQKPEIILWSVDMPISNVISLKDIPEIKMVKLSISRVRDKLKSPGTYVPNNPEIPSGSQTWQKNYKKTLKIAAIALGAAVLIYASYKGYQYLKKGKSRKSGDGSQK